MEGGAEGRGRDGNIYLIVVCPVKGWVACQRNEEHDPQAPHITLLAVTLAPQDLQQGGHRSFQQEGAWSDMTDDAALMLGECPQRMPSNPYLSFTPQCFSG